ncbi:polyphosphate kinase 1 [Lachnospira hominis (ex Liu et al. 2021)]|uniref:Polyphosphate kinase n=1 Tax=Lachnospira hominis (ex Liu et al. 2021) TaxID=2763051 RepID=A0ABR7G4V9_9FIRM|nr:polyphosphate kinase 1 [Lachnospira hominis]MBC5681816.1 polyphosphate kinase 1 [Lachnospira hominis]
MGGNIAKNKKEEIPKYREKTPCYENRELSWLKFNERVLDEASDKDVPLCERLSFASIFQSNLDEFFMVRVGSLHDQMLFSETKRESKTNMTAGEQLSHIFKAARDLTRKKDHTYRHLMDELKEYGVELLNFSDIEYDDAVYLENYFKEQIMPILSPQVVGKKQPFPFIKNKEIYAVALLGSKSNEKVGLVPCSNGILKRLISIPSERNKYMLVEELILHFMPIIFEKYQIKSKSLIRIIRNADIDVDEAVDDEDTDYRDMMEKLIRQRKKLCPVKMEYSRVLDEKIIHNLCKELNLNHEQIYYSESPLELSFVFGLQDALRNNKNLFYERHIQKNPSWYVSGKSVISQVEEADRFISYPYESMQPFIRMLQEAGEDEKVVSIKMTLYRVAKNSQIVESLISAAENGKEVVVLVELRARFDEENNIEWSRRLEDAGCRIIYGLDYTKVHSKLCLITYREEGQIKYVTQIGTGNYNEKTSKLYTDLSIITANKQIGMEAAYVFTRLCMGEFVDETNYLLVAPKCMKSKILNYMDKEIEIARNGGKAYVGAKINSLTDKEIIDKLIECSRAGVRVEMIVRGICCLIPGVKGHTENISVISIVGRYLEHSRVYIFGTPDRDNIYISSADFMTRNMERRVEIAAPIYDDSIKTRIRNMFHIMECDTVKARQLCSDGNYVHRTIADIKDFTDEEWEQASEGLRINSQEYFAAR